MSSPRDKLVDKLVFAFCQTHDTSELWEHARRDPEAFRNAVRHVLDKDNPETKHRPKAIHENSAATIQRCGLLDEASGVGAYLELSDEDKTIWCVVRDDDEIRKLSSGVKADSLKFPDVAYRIMPTFDKNGWEFMIQVNGKTATIRMFKER